MFHDRVDSSVVCKYTNNVIVFQICKKISGIKCVDSCYTDNLPLYYAYGNP